MMTPQTAQFGQFVLYILLAIFWFHGIDATIRGTSAIHQILAILYYGFGALVLASIAIIHAVNTAHRNHLAALSADHQANNEAVKEANSEAVKETVEQFWGASAGRSRSV